MQPEPPSNPGPHDAPAAFSSRIDAWLAALLLGSAALVLAALAGRWPAAAPGQQAVLMAMLAVGAGLPLWILATTGYRIDASTLTIRSGPFRWRVAVQDIRLIEPSRSWLSAPALSLDRLCIHHGRTGRMLVSPKDRDAFVQALQRRNPRIEVRGI